MKHTPAPWSVSTLEGYPGCFRVATPRPDDEHNDTPIALTVEHARLIAAAPDLLAALEDVAKLLNVAHDVRHILGLERTAALYAAIAKATQS